MARQTGPLLLTGSLGGVTFYTTDGIHYARAKKRAISKQRFKTSPSLEATRRNASIFAMAQKISCELYRALPCYQRSQKKVWYPLRNRAQELFRQGMEAVRVRSILTQEVLPLLLTQAFERKRERTAERKTQRGKQTVPEEQSLELGRYTRAVDNLSVLTELSAANILVRTLLDAGREKDRLLYTNREEKSFGRRKRLRG